MIDLSTRYLGLSLRSPLVPSSSPLVRELDIARQLEDAGAGALVMHSLFEETIHHEQKALEHFVHFQSLGNAEADSYLPVPDEYLSELDEYLEHLRALKDALDIPVIASLNGISNNSWLEYASEIEQAGADALELNVYYIAADPDITGEQVEERYLELLRRLKAKVNLPIAMKLTSQFSSVANMVKKLEQAGAAGAVLFNRFYQPDIDLETLRITPSLQLSSPTEALLRIRWIALLRSRVGLSLAATGGLHDVAGIIKALLAGADAAYLCSVLLQQGPGHLEKLQQDLLQWLESNEYESVSQMQGSVSQACAINPAAYEHANYHEVLDSFKLPGGVPW